MGVAIGKQHIQQGEDFRVKHLRLEISVIWTPETEPKPRWDQKCIGRMAETSSNQSLSLDNPIGFIVRVRPHETSHTSNERPTKRSPGKYGTSEWRSFIVCKMGGLGFYVHWYGACRLPTRQILAYYCAENHLPTPVRLDLQGVPIKALVQRVAKASTTI